MPRHFEKWSDNPQPPLVAYVPADINDEDLKVITAYDTEGNRHILNAQEAPNFPVIVLAINERVNKNGKLHPRLVTTKALKEPIGGGGTGGGDDGDGSGTYNETRSDGNVEYIRKIKVNNDHENWYLEPAEIRVKVLIPSLGGAVVDNLIGDPEPEDEWQNHYERLLRWYFGDYDDYIIMVWYEHDDDNTTFTRSFSATDPNTGISSSFSIEYTNDDDQMGRTLVNRRDPLSDVYSTGDIDWRHGSSE